MILKVLGSSSEGNCYFLQAQNETLIIEAGIKFAEVKKALNWQLGNVVGCLISHEHKDHSKYLSDFLKSGITVLALAEVFNSQVLKTRVFCKEIKPMHGYKVGGFKVLAIPVVHDVPCVGFIIEHEKMGKLLFITDTLMLEFRLPPLNHIMLEANYSDPILQYNIDNGIMPVSMRERLLRSHMELKTTAEILRVNDLSKVNEVILLHLSARNSDPEQFRQTIQKSAGKPVYIARNGLCLDLSLTPY